MRLAELKWPIQRPGSWVAMGQFGVQLAVIGGGIVMTLLELFICFLQAFIFTFLTVLFISMVATHHDEHQEEDVFADENQMDIAKLAHLEEITPMPDPAG